MFNRKETGEPRWLGPTTSGGRALIPSLSVARWILILIAGAGIYFFSGFLVPVLAALVVGFATWPFYARLLRAVRNNNAIAATIAILLIVTFLVLPLVFAIVYAVGEIKEWVAWAVHVNRDGAPAPLWIQALPGGGSWLSAQWEDYIGSPGSLGTLIQISSGAHLGNISRMLLAAGGGAFHLVLTLVFMMIVLFFVYKDGKKFSAQVDLLGERFLPNRWNRISRIVPITISSTVLGMTVIAIGEGIVLGTAYWVAGVPSALTLGVVTAFMALVPGGAPLSFTLVSIYLFASGEHVTAIALIIWGSVELFIVDKTLRPRLVGGPIKLPFLPTFFGLIGGVETMGFLGLFIGPVLMAIIVAIWREWIREAALSEEQIQQHRKLPESPLIVRRDAVDG